MVETRAHSGYEVWDQVSAVPLRLPNVTLVAVSSIDIRRTVSAVRSSCEDIEFGAVKLLSHRRYRFVNNTVDQVAIGRLSSIDDYNRFMLYQLGHHVETSHCLVVQADGYVLNPQQWDPAFLDYDYIGAAWPLKADAYIDPFGQSQRVGNGGFSLRSRKLLTVPQRRNVPWEVNKGDFYRHMDAGLYSEDGNICVHNRHIYSEEGCVFAPIEVAVRFSQETQLPETLGVTPFGFHKRLPGRDAVHRAPFVSGWWR